MPNVFKIFSLYFFTNVFPTIFHAWYAFIYCMLKDKGEKIMTFGGLYLA